MAPKKRGHDGSSSQSSGRARKRQRVQAARHIDVQRPSQAAGSASTVGMHPSLDPEKVLKARTYEISALERSMRSSQCAQTPLTSKRITNESYRNANSQRAFQTVPRHLRRRAASHDPRRLPLRLRERARKEMLDDGTKKPAKRKLRKISAYKRKKIMLVGRKTDLERRSKAKHWLETHLWHAKRMHMAELWGHKILRPLSTCLNATSPTEKSFRPSQRAAAEGAVVQDVSYTVFYQVTWTPAALRKAFDLITDPQAISPCSARYSAGLRVCHTTFYEPRGHPDQMIGPATLLWKPTTGVDGDMRTLLVSVHPSMAAEASRVLRDALGQAATGLGKYAPIFGLKQLKLCAFDVAGRRAGEILARTLLPQSKLEGAKKEAWKRLLCMSPEAFPDKMVVGVSCEDPRLSFPPKPKGKATRIVDADQPAVFPVAETASCPDFWAALSDKAKKLRYSKAELDARRAKELVPGTRTQPQASDDVLPVLLYRHEPVGWTLLAPAGWGMAIWPSLVHAGPRVGAQVSLRQKQLEACLPSFPFDFPGTPAYDREMARDAAEREKLHMARPPAKRIAYAKLGTDLPFRAIWPENAHVLSRPPVADPDETQDGSSGALVHVLVYPLSRGRPETLAQIFALPDDGIKDNDELPEACKTAGSIGSVTTGGYSLKRGKGHGLGCVSSDAFQRGLADSSTRLPLPHGKKGVKVLFKNPASSKVRLGRLELIAKLAGSPHAGW